MFRKQYFTFLLAISFILAAGLTTLAQMGSPVRGRVEMTKNGAKVPVPDATVDAFRNEGKGKITAKTNKKGEFSYAGLMLGQTYTLAVSAPGIRPQVYPKVKSGMDAIVIEVIEGDGKVLTEEEAKTLANQALPAEGEQLTEAQKKEIEEINKKNAELTAKIERTKEADAIASRVFTEGVKAIEEKNYDLAIAKMDEGIAAVPDFVGTTPILMGKKAIALKEKALIAWKDGRTSTDPAVKLAKNAEAKKYFLEGLAVYDRAMNMIKTSAAPTDAQNIKSQFLTKTELLLNAMDSHRLLARTGVDTTLSKEASAVFEEYFAFETDPVKKSKQTMILADIYRNDGECDSAAVHYKKILQTAPEDPDALAGAGLCMFTVGVSNNDKAVMQEGLNLMEHFAQVAPDTHELKASVKEAVDYLKTEQNLKAQKPATTPRKKN
jgi:tetratricopeptide (TPR) repeat protein